MSRTEPRHDFLRDIIDADLAAGRHQRVATRFPPEPNGYLHIGHAKSICLNFGLARDYQGTCNLRYDDTNPAKEDVEYVTSIERDVRWLGFAPTAVLFSADYFPRMYELAEKLIQDGKAYVCDLTDEQIREYRGTLAESGKPSPWRDRSVEENLALFRKMRAGELADGACVLRAKIDMASSNMKMRDPLLYRIRHAHHHRTGDQWCIYPMYDYAHPLEDAFEQITHSICTLEFENNRELYDWVLKHTEASGSGPAPRQYEFARLALDYTVMSKRKLLQLVQGGHVAGWDDPRMPTIAGMRRRGYSAEAIRTFCDMIGISKANSTVDIGKLEYCVRDDLNRTAPRALAVLRPLEVELTNAVALESMPVPSAPFFPGDMAPQAGSGTSGKGVPPLPETRELPLGSRLFIDADDFRDDPPADYQRLAPGRTVRLRYGPCITCDDVVRDHSGTAIRLRCTVHADTATGKNPGDGRKVHGVIHWVDAATSVPAEIRIYEQLFASAKPDEGGIDFLTQLTPSSLEVMREARLEQSLATAAPGTRWQFERLGYFIADQVDHGATRPVFNRIVALRDAQQKKDAKDARDAKAEPAAPRQENAKAKTRPKSRSPQEYRAEARVRDAELAAAYDRAQAMGLSAGDADLLSGDRATATLFTDVAARADAKQAAKWIINELPRVIGERELEEAVSDVAQLAANLAELIGLLDKGEVTGSAAKELLAATVESGRSPVAIADERGMRGALDEAALEQLVDQVIGAHPDKVAQVRAGKTGLVGFLVGQVVKASGGKAQAAAVSQLLTRRLAG